MNTGLWSERIKGCLALGRWGTARYMCMHVAQPVSLHNSAFLTDTILPVSFKGLYFAYSIKIHSTHQNDHILNGQELGCINGKHCIPGKYPFSKP